MMPAQRKSIKSTLEKAKLYDPKLDYQIELAEMLRKMLKGDLKDEHRLKALAQLQSAYTALGLTYETNPNRITAPEPEKPTALETLMTEQHKK